MLTATLALATRSPEITAAAVRDLGPFCHRDKFATDSRVPTGRDLPPVFYADISLGVRVVLALPGTVPGLTPDALLMPGADGGWEIFGDDGLLAAYDADAIHVSVCQ